MQVRLRSSAGTPKKKLFKLFVGLFLGMAEPRAPLPSPGKVGWNTFSQDGIHAFSLLTRLIVFFDLLYKITKILLQSLYHSAGPRRCICVFPVKQFEKSCFRYPPGW